MRRVKTYSAVSKWLHWGVAILVIPMLGSFYLESLPKLYKDNAVMLHKSFGLVVLCLMIARVCSLYHRQRPELLMMPTWEKIFSRVVQYAFYVVLLAMPMVGWMMTTAGGRPPNVFGLFILPCPFVPLDKALSDTLFSVHRALAFVIIGLLSLHVAGALKHWLINRDSVMQSMWPTRRREG